MRNDEVHVHTHNQVDSADNDEIDTSRLVMQTQPQPHDGGKLGTVLLACVVFYNVSGGPFGIEETIRSAGNLYSILGFLLMPIVWSVPEAIVTAELGSAFPEPAGGVAWVQEAFGERAAWFSGYLSWVAGATDNAIYPVLFLDYLVQTFFPESNNLFGSSTWSRFIFVSLTTAALGYVNWRGLKIVGSLSLVIGCIALSPFVVLLCVGVFKINPGRWMETSPGVDIDGETDGGFFPSLSVGGVLMRPFLNNLFWNLNSFDSAASFGADVKDVARTFPSAMGLSVIMVTAGYIMPLLVVLGATETTPKDWVDGYLATAATSIVGPWLGAWTVFAAGVSNVALFQAELSADAYQVMGMADRGHLPRIFSRRSKYGTPTYGILLGLAVIGTIITVSELDELIEVLNFNYAISLLTEYSAFIQLRRRRPDLVRPWKFPAGIMGCGVLLFLPCIFTILTMALATFQTYIFSIFVILIGEVLYRLRVVWQTQSYDELRPHVIADNEPATDFDIDNTSSRS